MGTSNIMSIDYCQPCCWLVLSERYKKKIVVTDFYNVWKLRPES